MIWILYAAAVQERDQLRGRVAELERQREELIDACSQVDWISSCQVREILGQECQEEK